MSTLLAIGYPDEATATQAEQEMQRLAKDLIIEPDAVAVITRDREGKLKVSTNHHAVGGGAMWGMFWGGLFGLLFFIPFFGMAVGAGTATAVSNRVSRRQAGRWAQQDQDRQDQEDQRQQPAVAQASSGSADPMQSRIGQLNSLADLKAQGILTEEEFQAQKNAILNR